MIFAASFGSEFVINFAFCPIYMRVPFTAVVSMLWTVVLSAMRGQPEALDDKADDLLLMPRIDEKGRTGE